MDWILKGREEKKPTNYEVHHSASKSVRCWTSRSFFRLMKNQVSISAADTDVRHLVKRTSVLGYDLFGNTVQCKRRNWLAPEQAVDVNVPPRKG